MKGKIDFNGCTRVNLLRDKESVLPGCCVVDGPSVFGSGGGGADMALRCRWSSVSGSEGWFSRGSSLRGIICKLSSLTRLDLSPPELEEGGKTICSKDHQCRPIIPPSPSTPGSSCPSLASSPSPSSASRPRPRPRPRLSRLLSLLPPPPPSRETMTALSSSSSHPRGRTKSGGGAEPS